jgi:PKD repeat protein
MADDDDDEIDIDRASWSDWRDRLTVEGDKAPRNATVTIRYGEKGDNGAVIGTTTADRRGDWEFRISDIEPVPCDVTAEAGRDDDDKRVRRAPSNCSNDGGSQPPANEPPIADANGPYTGTTGNAVSFSSAGSNDPDGDITSYSWNFGDGSSSNQANPSHTYTTAGTYNVTLTVTDNDGASDSDATTATITDTPPVNVPPTANANGPYSEATGVDVSFSSAGSGDSDGTITSYAWTFGDGATSTAANPNHAYATAGTYNVSLTVTDNDGASDSDATTATITDTPPVNVPPTANANGPYSGITDSAVSFSSAGSSDSDGTITGYSWNFGDGSSSNQANPSHTYVAAGTYTVTLTVTDNNGATGSDATTATITDALVDCTPLTGVSINSTSQSGCAEQAIPVQDPLLNGAFRVLAINDLGMHCGDYDTRISSILPPFQVLLGQVIERGVTPTLNPAGVSLEYSAVSNEFDPILNQIGALRGLKDDGTTYKTNFWDAVSGGAYDPFYPAGVTPLSTGPFPVFADQSLPVPNVEELYIGADGIVDQPGGSQDGTLTAVQHAMPGLTNPYVINDPQTVNEHYGDKPFFLNFPFGYVAEGVNWYEGAGAPFAAYDDFGYENPYPLVRVEAKQGATTVATIDTVLPISGEASCTNCHSDPADTPNSRTSQPTDVLNLAGLPVAVSLDDPDQNLPIDVSREYAADINILRLHDLTHGAKYVDTAGISTPCDVTTNGGNGDANCLINQALVQGKPTVCQVCHYTPALDLAQVGPVAGPPGSDANGRNQLSHSSNSNVMHSHHGGLGNLFPVMPEPVQTADGTITNQTERLAVLEETCYQCHPGTTSQCLRGAMFNGGMLCNDCHGSMEQVGADFSQNVTPDNPAPGSLLLGGDFYDPNDPQPRVPWANEPGCGSCHTGDVRDNMIGTANTIANTRDVDGNVDNLRFRQAYVSGDAKATPIVPTNKRFAEPAVPATFTNADGSTFANPGAGNPQLYRVSTGHGGVMCEGCHGATHAEWPNANPMSNDNVTAEQLQGHTGAITECIACHTDLNSLGTDGSTASLQGPHGMHVVGNTSFADGGHRRNLNRNACRDCHGENGEGSVLSRTAADRNLPDVGFVPKGTPITCTMCHGNEL